MALLAFTLPPDSGEKISLGRQHCLNVILTIVTTAMMEANVNVSVSRGIIEHIITKRFYCLKTVCLKTV